jgi:CRISPR-associated protein Cas1
LESCRIAIRRKDEEPAFVPLEDLAMLVLDYAHATLTVPLLAALAESEIAVLVAGPKHLPVASLVPFASHHQSAFIARAQAEAAEPRNKRVWQQIVRSKIENQAACLDVFNLAGDRIRPLINLVGSGDPRNVEGRAAAAYWPILLGEDFLRIPQADGVNSMLDYGYALVRAAVCRAICAAGLHPAFGVHHHNRYDAYALADDAMEPLRPLVDQRVKHYIQLNGEPEALGTSQKRWLYPILTATMSYDGRRYPMWPALELYAAALRRAIVGDARKVPCPESFALEE